MIGQNKLGVFSGILSLNLQPNRFTMKTKNALLTWVLSFFFIGLGYVYLGNKRILGIGLAVAGFILTFVEWSIKDLDHELYWLMFMGILVLNTCMAIDGYKMA